MHHAINVALSIVVALSFVSGSAVADEQLAATTPSLSPTQISRFLSSYPAAQEMAQAYWGERHFTPPRKMLDPESTFERAFSEMRFAGKLREFDALLQAHGFEDRNAWLRLAYRLSDAYVALRTQEMGPEIMQRYNHALDVRYQAIVDQRKAAENLPEAERKSQLRSLQSIQAELDSEKRAMEDAPLLRPYSSQLRTIEEFIPHKKTAKFITSKAWSRR